jgi:hypothetical protein
LTSPVRGVCLAVSSLIRSQPIIAFGMCSELAYATCEVQPKICTPAKVACRNFYDSIMAWLQSLRLFPCLPSSSCTMVRAINYVDAHFQIFLAVCHLHTRCFRPCSRRPVLPLILHRFLQSAPAPTLVACRRASLGYRRFRRHSQVWAEGYSCSFGRWGSRVHMARQATTIFAVPMFYIRNSIICILRPC